MRKFVCAVLAFVLCVSLALPAFAAFTPSVAVKETPVVSTVIANNGKEVTNEEGLKAVATIVTDAGGKDEEETHVFEGSLVITTVSDAKAGKQTDKNDEKLTKQEKEIQKDLKKVYDDMEKGKLEIPYEEVGLKAEKMVVRELFSIAFHPDEKHAKDDVYFDEIVKEEGNHLRMTLDLGVSKNDKVYVMVYAENEDGKKVWQKMEAVNNGDGTITVEFVTLGIVAVCVEQ